MSLAASSPTATETAELIHTVAGSFGIVAVAPVTALAAGLLLAKGDVSEK